jgi:hypothetical protein
MIYHKAEKNPIALALFPCHCGFRGRLTMCYNKARGKKYKKSKKN